MGRFAFTLVAGTLVAGVLFSGAAQASSIIALDAMDEPIGPSMIVIGAPAVPAMVKEETATGTQLAYPFPGGTSTPVVSLDSGRAEGDFVATSPSIVGLAEPDGVDGDEKVAAIGEDEDARRRPHSSPMVIRGGIVGDTFSRTVAPASAPQPRETASADAHGPAPRSQREAEAAPPPPAGMPELPAPR